MLVVDVLAVLILLAGLAIGVSRGLVATAGSIIGLVAGVVAAVLIVPLVAPGVADWQYRTLVLAAVAMAVVAVCTGVGTGIGMRLRRGVDRARLKVVDRVLGGIVDTAAAGLVILLTAGALTASGTPIVSTAVGSSRVVVLLDRLTPTEVDLALAQLRGFVIDEGIPRFEELLAPEVEPTAPPVSLDDPELQQAAASVARVSGTAYACGTSMTGSGFVAESGLIITNAHVVAGVGTPVIELPGRAPREGRIVYFDPVDDLAAIAVEGLDATPLEIVQPVAAGTPVAVQGYPLGGPFTSGAAYVLSVGAAPVDDIYEEGTALREIYALEANVQPGNSGGPLLTDDGAVTGVVFARGQDGEQRGYAMTTTELTPVLDAVDATSAGVSSGSCAR